MKKVLFTANLDSFFYKFLMPYLKWFKEQGYEVHVATKGNDFEIPYCDQKFNVSFARTPFTFDNIKSYMQMKKILKENQYDIIHCHTPLGGVITRLAANKYRKKGTRVIYTAHGFHFFKGASKINWLIYYNVEKFLAKYTDTLLTMNKEDYENAKAFKAGKIIFVNGVGVPEEKFKLEITEEEKKELRTSLEIKDSDFVMIYAAELLKRKNQKYLIDTFNILNKKYDNMILLLPGNDSLNGEYQKYVEELGLSNKIKFLGFRKDVPKLLRISNLAVSSSTQEGLPVNIMEAMYAGLPVVCTDCRGQVDLIKDGENGYLVSLNDKEKFASLIEKVYNSESLAIKFGEENKKRIRKYLLSSVVEEMEKIYLEEISEVKTSESKK